MRKFIERKNFCGQSENSFVFDEENKVKSAALKELLEIKFKPF